MSRLAFVSWLSCCVHAVVGRRFFAPLRQFRQEYQREKEKTRKDARERVRKALWTFRDIQGTVKGAVFPLHADGARYIACGL